MRSARIAGIFVHEKAPEIKIIEGGALRYVTGGADAIPS